MRAQGVVGRITDALTSISIKQTKRVQQQTRRETRTGIVLTEKPDAATVKRRLPLSIQSHSDGDLCNKARGI